MKDELDRLSQYIGKASFAHGADRHSAMQCIRLLYLYVEELKEQKGCTFCASDDHNTADCPLRGGAIILPSQYSENEGNSYSIMQAMARNQVLAEIVELNPNSTCVYTGVTKGHFSMTPSQLQQLPRQKPAATYIDLEAMNGTIVRVPAVFDPHYASDTASDTVKAVYPPIRPDGTK